MTNAAQSFGRAERKNAAMTKNTRIPGPGTYDYYSSNNQPTYSIGRGNREPIKAKHFVPGPGNYDLTGDGKNTMISIAKKLGSSLDPKGRTPGPGNYDPGNVRSSI